MSVETSCKSGAAEKDGAEPVCGEIGGPAPSGETLYLLALRALPSGDKIMYRANRLGIAGSVVWRAGSKEVEKTLGLKPEAASDLCRLREGVCPEAELERIYQAGMRVCSPWDAEYPGALRTVSHPPPLLYYRGHLGRGLSPGVAVIGSRSCTAYGKRVAVEMARSLSLAGVSVISGVARGIDAYAHAGALEGQGGTIGVLGCGLDVIYPPENARLYKEIAENGALISEYAPGSSPLAGRFPARNRIISGLSRAVVVVEAGERSGALITAGHALDQGREVFVVPGSVYSPLSRGTHRLLRDGAAPVCSAEELLEELGLESRTEATSEAGRLAPGEQAVLAAVPWIPAHVDEIAAAARVSAAEALVSLLLLEVKGLVLAEKGKRYLRVS